MLFGCWLFATETDFQVVFDRKTPHNSEKSFLETVWVRSPCFLTVSLRDPTPAVPCLIGSVNFTFQACVNQTTPCSEMLFLQTEQTCFRSVLDRPRKRNEFLAKCRHSNNVFGVKTVHITMYLCLKSKIHF